MTRQTISALAVILVLLGAGCGGSSSSGGGNPEEIETTLDEQNGSAESGTALLTTVGERTRVVIELESPSATPVAPRQPAHIHKGSCEEIDPTPAYALNDVMAGTSTTTVDAKLSDLGDGKFVINVHESADNIERYVACGIVGAGDGKGYDPLGHDKESDY
jgi:hypothetical protein